MRVILYQPDIPQNTGNIIRTCALTNTQLSVVEPLGFVLSNRTLSRAGLDYVADFPIERIDDFDHFLETTEEPFYLFSSRARRRYTEVTYHRKTQLIFGSETRGLPPHVHKRWADRLVTLPMIPNTRCLNLSNAVAVALYEGWRQLNFSF